MESDFAESVRAERSICGHLRELVGFEREMRGLAISDDGRSIDSGVDVVGASCFAFGDLDWLSSAYQADALAMDTRNLCVSESNSYRSCSSDSRYRVAAKLTRTRTRRRRMMMLKICTSKMRL